MVRVSNRQSEIILIAILVAITGFTRIYYGGTEPPRVVWKSEFGYGDTLVNLNDLLKMPRAEILQQHPSVLYQLEEMGLMEVQDSAGTGNH